jgi:hypothetical protein
MNGHARLVVSGDEPWGSRVTMTCPGIAGMSLGDDLVSLVSREDFTTVIQTTGRSCSQLLMGLLLAEHSPLSFRPSEPGSLPGEREPESSIQ